MSNFVIPATPAYSSILRMLETTDPAHADSFNPMFLRLLENDEYFRLNYLPVSKLANNGITTASGYGVDARYAKVLTDNYNQLNTNLDNLKTLVYDASISTIITLANITIQTSSENRITKDQFGNVEIWFDIKKSDGVNFPQNVIIYPFTLPIGLRPSKYVYGKCALYLNDATVYEGFMYAYGASLTIHPIQSCARIMGYIRYKV